MKILIACELSGVVRDAFIREGFSNTWSCDLWPCESDFSNQHYQCDCLDIINDNWNLVIAHPPCTHLSVSGARHWWKKRMLGLQGPAVQFCKDIFACNADSIAMENPVGILSSRIRKPDQIIQPYWFGESFSKKTCLWLKNLPLLQPTNIVDPGEFVTFPSGKRLAKWQAYFPTKTRAKDRSKTFQGIADAMASQWGAYLKTKL